MSDATKILEGRSALGIELGSTRIKACLVDADEPTRVLAVGSHEWENEFTEDRRWSYPLAAVWSPLTYSAPAATVVAPR